MAQALSRQIRSCAGRRLGLQLSPATCHELSHTWNPDCGLAIWDAFWPSLGFCLRTYASLYTLKALWEKGGRVGEVDWRRLLANTIRSTAFLITTEILFMSWLCAFRRMLGFATWPTISFVNGFAACFLSIWIESKRRRAMLVPYLLNLASEALFRQALNRRLILRPLAHGQALIFGFSVALIVAIMPHSFTPPQSPNTATSSIASFLRSLFRQTLGFKCGNSNFSASTTRSAILLSLRNSGLSFCLLSLLNVLGRGNRRKGAADSIWPSLKLPSFLAAMPLLMQLLTRLLSSIPQQQNRLPVSLSSAPVGLFPSRRLLLLSASAGLASGLAMGFCWPNSTLALYLFWKMVELAYFRAVEAQLAPLIPGADAFLFSAVSAYLLGVAVLEPHALRPSYYKFLCAVTGNKLQLFNRALIDHEFQTRSRAVLHQDFVARLQPHLLTINPAFYSPSSAPN